MRLINVETFELESFADHRSTPDYAILSHTWGAEEVLFHEVQPVTEATKEKLGWKKIEYTCSQAQKDGLKYAWVDTCCIDKSSSAELSEAINSMFAWYEESEVCYAYLADVDRQPKEHRASSEHDAAGDGPGPAIDRARLGRQSFIVTVDEDAATVKEESHSGLSTEARDDPGLQKARDSHKVQSDDTKRLDSVDSGYVSTFEDQFKASRWFTRGWTLQELVAPRHLEFYSSQWKALGSLRDLAPIVKTVTNIPMTVILHDVHAMSLCAARRMSWAAARNTTRLEDQAYSLLGLFRVNMPLLYGEGQNAFVRLQEEILRVSGDTSILAWELVGDDHGHREPFMRQLFATCPARFSRSAYLRTAEETKLPSISVSSGRIQAILPIVSIGHIFRKTFVGLQCYDERYPMKVLALEALRTGNNDNSFVVRPSWGHDAGPRRLHLLSRSQRLRPAEIDLWYRRTCLTDIGTQLLYVRLVEPSPKRGYRLKMTDAFPDHRWNLDGGFCEPLRWRGNVITEGFTFLVEPETSDIKCSTVPRNPWKVEVEWNETGLSPHGNPDDGRFVVRCHTMTDSEVLSHRIGDPQNPGSPGCDGRDCLLLRWSVQGLRLIYNMGSSLIFEGLGAGYRLRFFLVIGNDSYPGRTLCIVLEKADYIQRIAWSPQVLSGLEKTIFWSQIPLWLVGTARRVFLTPPTKVARNVYQGSYMDHGCASEAGGKEDFSTKAALSYKMFLRRQIAARVQDHLDDYKCVASGRFLEDFEDPS